MPKKEKKSKGKKGSTAEDDSTTLDPTKMTEEEIGKAIMNGDLPPDWEEISKKKAVVADEEELRQKILDGEIDISKDQVKVSRSNWRKQVAGQGARDAAMEQRIMDGELPPDLVDAGKQEIPGDYVNEEEAMRRIMDGEM
eukprot:m.79719 g.79719  ORF g.79719 m.79719 type:complete len:140 (-) comp16288_c0_seq1:225-644(-)